MARNEGLHNCDCGCPFCNDSKLGGGDFSPALLPEPLLVGIISANGPPCRACGGSGGFNQSYTWVQCSLCAGSGVTTNG